MEERLEREAGLLTHADEVANLLRRLVGLDFDLSLEAREPPRKVPCKAEPFMKKRVVCWRRSDLRLSLAIVPNRDSCVSIQKAMPTLK